MSDCPRLGKLFGGCKFSPRYDTVSAVSDDPFFHLAVGAKPPEPKPARKTYLGDVCERCGKTLFRRKPTANATATTQRQRGAGVFTQP